MPGNSVAETVAASRRHSEAGREVAEAVLFLSNEGASYITGQVIAVNGGFVM